MSNQSETLRETGPELDLGGQYGDIVLLKESPRGRIFSACRAGKRFLLKAAASSSTRDMEALKREYELSLSLSHPGIAYIFTYEESSPVGPCIVMEYVDGRTLGEWLAEKPTLTSRNRLFAQLLDTVEYIHRKGILHNDLSPSNILVTRSDNDLKLIDFGFADDDIHFVGKGRGCTRRYASPELLEGLPTDSRSDIYSIGMLMRDIFGCRHSRIRHIASRRNPALRFASVASLRRAWKRTFWLPPVCVIALLLCAVGTLLYTLQASQQRMEAEQEQLVEELRRREDALRQKSEELASYKARVDSYYSDVLAPAGREVRAAGNYDLAMERWTSMTQEYNAFWKQLLDSCPEEYSAELMSYISWKFNSEYPPVPQRWE